MNKLMQQVDLGIAGAKVSQFMTWWGQTLLSSLPEGLQGAVRRSSPSIAVYGSNVSGEQAVTLSFSDDRILSKVIKLPLAVEASLSSAILIQLERLSPLPIDQIIYGWKVVERSDDQLSVSLNIVKRDIAESEVARHKAAGVTVLNIISPDGTQYVNCEPIIKARMKTQLRRLGLYLSMAMIFIVSLLIMSVRLDQGINEESVHLTRLMQENQDVISARRTVSEHKARLGFLRAKYNETDAIKMLDFLTAILPESAWLNSLSITANEIKFEGIAENAAELAVLLGKASSISNVRLRTVTPSNNGERFEMILTIDDGENDHD